MYNLKGIENLLKDIEERRQRLEKKAYNKKVGYAPKCKVCNSEYLDEIEELREDGLTYEEILEELEIDNISIMSLSRHFQNHYPNSKAYKEKQQIQMLENIREAYIKYPFLENYFKNKELGFLEEFNTEYGFCTDRFGLCSHLKPSTVSNGHDNIHRLYRSCNEEIESKKSNWYFDKEDETKIKLQYQNIINICLNCKNQIQEERLTLLEKIITYNFLNIPPENKEIYFNLLEFDGNPEEFIQTLEEANTENQPAK